MKERLNIIEDITQEEEPDPVAVVETILQETTSELVRSTEKEGLVRRERH